MPIDLLLWGFRLVRFLQKAIFGLEDGNFTKPSPDSLPGTSDFGLGRAVF
jgi:hypothetical protein